VIKNDILYFSEIIFLIIIIIIIFGRYIYNNTYYIILITFETILVKILIEINEYIKKLSAYQHCNGEFALILVKKILIAAIYTKLFEWLR